MPNPPLSPTSQAVDLTDEVLDVAGILGQYVEATPLGILVIDGQGIIAYVNQSLCSIFGYESRELLGQPIELLVPDAIKAGHVQLRDAYLANPVQRLMHGREVRGRRKNGTEAVAAIGLNPLFHGHTVWVACTVMDLSESRRTEETLVSFFDLSVDLLCIASTDGSFLRVNPNFPRLLGYSEQELLNCPFIDFVHPDDVTATRAAVAQLAAGQPVVRFRNRYRQVQGSYLWIEWSARAIETDGVIYAVGRDVTEEMKFQKELRTREDRERSILDNTPAVVYFKDAEGRYLYFNQRFANLFSLDHSTILGKTDYEIFPIDLARNFVKNDREVVETRQRITVQELAPHRDGLHTYVTVKFPLFDADGNVSGVAGISTDITEQIRSQNLRNELNLAAEFQRKLFPKDAPRVTGLDISGSAVPVTQLCGDYYDFFVTGAGRVALAVGDVSGHGFGPALAMVEVRSILRGLLHYGSHLKLSEVLWKLNQLLVDDLPDGCFVSLFVAELDTIRRQLQYAGAGHQAVLIRDEACVDVLTSTAPVLGLMNSITIPDRPPIPIRENDLLFIFTDGVSEARNRQGDLFTSKRATDVVATHRHESSAGIIQQVFAHVLKFANGNPIIDDMTAVVAKFLPARPGG